MIVGSLTLTDLFEQDVLKDILMLSVFEKAANANSSVLLTLDDAILDRGGASGHASIGSTISTSSPYA